MRTDWRADDGDSESYKYTIRQDEQRGSASGDGRPPFIPELGHRGYWELARTDGVIGYRNGHFIIVSREWADDAVVSPFPKDWDSRTETPVPDSGE